MINEGYPTKTVELITRKAIKLQSKLQLSAAKFAAKVHVAAITWYQIRHGFDTGTPIRRMGAETLLKLLDAFPGLSVFKDGVDREFEVTTKV